MHLRPRSRPRYPCQLVKAKLKRGCCLAREFLEHGLCMWQGACIAIMASPTELISSSPKHVVRPRLWAMMRLLIRSVRLRRESRRNGEDLCALGSPFSPIVRSSTTFPSDLLLTDNQNVKRSTNRDHLPLYSLALVTNFIVESLSRQRARRKHNE